MARLQNKLPRRRDLRLVHDYSPQFVSLFAQASPAGGEERELIAYELRRLAEFDDPRLLWLLLGLAVAAILGYVAWIYTRERDALSRPWRLLLTGLRGVAIAALVIYFLGPEKRTDREMVEDSRVVVLVDTSQSMSVEDESTTEAQKASRLAALTKSLAEANLLDQLQLQNDVVIATFDEGLNRRAHWDRKSLNTSEAESEQTEGETSSTEALLKELQPEGVETRLGEALREALEPEGGGPLAGVIVFSDGGQNSGVAALETADLAASQQVPLFTIGLGSTQPRRNLRVQELTAPARVYPDDKTTITCLIQGEGYAGRTVDVELYAREAEATGGAATRIANQRVTLPAEGEDVALKFDFQPAEVGRLALEARVLAPLDDQYPPDNRREIEVEVVETDLRVLLIAGGASRDYRFLRNQLRRDRHMRVDVWLQLSPPGISQDADQLLTEFPATKEALYEYDCLVAFDPDWTLLDALQVEMLEAWVAEEAGGMIVVAGPVNTAAWLQSPEHLPIRALYPVEFQQRLTLLDDGLYGSKTPWPLDFSREGEESEFLWLGDTSVESRSLWSQFEGVYGCYAVKGPKPGAQVLARYSDPDAGLSVDRPVYLAEHFYGAGRVMYWGSSELWRLRSMSIEFFETLYTKLIRHVSQGRILRGSTLGRLLVPRDRYSLGDDVVLRAQLFSPSREPLLADRVMARILLPDGNLQNLPMLADPERPGNFVGQWTVREEGSYRVELPIPDSVDEPLVHRIQVVAPDLEFDDTRRNESLLAALASRSGGRYYKTLASALEGNEDLRPVAELIESRAETKVLRGTPDQQFTEWLHRLLLLVFCSCLCIEWLSRRLLRLS